MPRNSVKFTSGAASLLSFLCRGFESLRAAVLPVSAICIIYQLDAKRTKKTDIFPLPKLPFRFWNFVQNFKCRFQSASNKRFYPMGAIIRGSVVAAHVIRKAAFWLVGFSNISFIRIFRVLQKINESSFHHDISATKLTLCQETMRPATFVTGRIGEPTHRA